MQSASTLHRLLSDASIEDLAVLARIITDNGRGRAALDGDICRRLSEPALSDPPSHSLADEVGTICQEIELFGGNSIVNLFRGRGVSYEEIVRDVAEHLKIEFTISQSTAEIEMQILLKVLEPSFMAMDQDSQAALIREISNDSGVSAVPSGMAGLRDLAATGGATSYRIALLVANGVARSITGRGLAITASAGMLRGLGAFAGPIGLSITMLWTMFELASPAYRVTIPCVVIISYIRQKSLIAGGESCPSCFEKISVKSKYCPECGAKISSPA